MAIEVKHPFVSNKGDGSDATLVRPSNWNDTHKVELTTNKIIGRLTPGFGDAEELPVTAYMIGLLNHPDFASLAAVLGLPTTGDARLTYKQSAIAGWVLANDGSIGSATSGATTRAHADTLNLFTFFYDTMWEGFAPLQNSTGAPTTRVAQGTAATAFTNNCRMVLPKAMGRAIVVGGVADVPGAGLSQRWTGQTGGEESHVLSVAELAAHTHTQQGTFGSNTVDVNHYHNQQGTFGTDARDINHTHQQQGTFGSTGVGDHSHSYDRADYNPSFQKPSGFGTVPATGNSGQSTGGAGVHSHTTTISGGTGFMDGNNVHSHSVTLSGTTTYIAGGSISHAHSTTIGGETAPAGANLAHNNMQPWTGMSVMIKL